MIRIINSDHSRFVLELCHKLPFILINTDMHEKSTIEFELADGEEERLSQMNVAEVIPCGHILIWFIICTEKLLTDFTPYCIECYPYFSVIFSHLINKPLSFAVRGIDIQHISAWKSFLLFLNQKALY